MTSNLFVFLSREIIGGILEFFLPWEHKCKF